MKNNDGDSSALREKQAEIARQTDEARVFRDIMQKLMQKMQSMDPMDQNTSLMDGKEYEKERQVLLSLNALGLREGIAVGFLTMFILRGVPRLTRRYLISRSNNSQGGGSGGYQLDRSNNHTAPNPFENQQRKYNMTSAMLGGLKLGLDLFVSVLMAASTSLYCLDEKFVAEQCAALPLIEGKSLVCDNFCETIQSEIAKRPPEFWAQAQHFSLIYTHEFATNCYKRQAYERKLREEQGIMNENESVAIPAGGVPDDFEGWDSYDTSQIMGDVSAGGDTTLFGEFSDADNQWAEGMVTDQEDDKRWRFQ